jgi:tetratricopeptide (TPR) repeat protein
MVLYRVILITFGLIAAGRYTQAQNSNGPIRITPAIPCFGGQWTVSVGTNVMLSVYAKSGQWDKAIADFSDAITRNPKDVTAYENRMSAYLMENKTNEAIADLSKMIELEPTMLSTLDLRGAIYTTKGDLDRAIDDCTECLKIDPTHFQAYMMRASAFTSKHEFDKAIKDWNEGLRLSPHDAKALALRGYAWSMKSNFDKAVTDYNEAIRIDPSNDQAYNHLAWLRATCPLRAMRNDKEAVECATKACELSDWTRWEYIDTLATAFAEAGDFERAVYYENDALAINEISEGDRNYLKRRKSSFEKRQAYHEADQK